MDARAHPVAVPSWQAAADAAFAAVHAGAGRVVVSGAAGTGKTALLQSTVQRLRAEGWTVLAAVASLPGEAALASLSGAACLVVDEADRLSEAELRRLERLRRVPVLLAGRSGLEVRCPPERHVALLPLGADEVRTFARGWADAHAGDPALVAPAAAARLASVSDGNLRALALLLSAAADMARAEAAERIDERHVDAAAWRQVEAIAAQRLARAAPPPPAGIERRLRAAPLAEGSLGEETPAPARSRRLERVLLGAGLLLLLLAVLLGSRQWLAGSAATRPSMSGRADPAPPSAWPRQAGGGESRAA